MLRNPFKRKIEDDTQHGLRAVLMKPFKREHKIGDDSQDGRRALLLAGGVAAFLGLAYVAVKRLGLASALTKGVKDVGSGIADAGGGAGDAVESASSPASAPASGKGA